MNTRAHRLAINGDAWRNKGNGSCGNDDVFGRDNTSNIHTTCTLHTDQHFSMGLNHHNATSHKHGQPTLSTHEERQRNRCNNVQHFPLHIHVRQWSALHNMGAQTKCNYSVRRQSAPYPLWLVGWFTGGNPKGGSGRGSMMYSQQISNSFPHLQVQCQESITV